MRLMYWLLAGCFFTASFDLIFIINLGGQLRISQLLLLILSVAALARTLQDGRILWPRGATGLVLWLVSQLMFLPLSIVISMGVQFFGLLSFTIAGVFAVIQLFGRSLNLERVMRTYILSYVFVAAFGLLQFALPLLKLSAPLVQQWILHGRIARINGFNYEPSYYSTYLIMGWIMLVDLRHSKAHITSTRKWKWLTYLVTASLVLSTSRTAWVFMFFELIARTLPRLAATLRSMFHQSRRGQMLLRLPRGNLVITSVVFVLLVVGAAKALITLVDPIAFLQGTGIAGTAAHSSAGRLDGAIRTLDGFAQNPFIGRSLGGVAPYLAERDGIIVHNIDEAHPYQGYPVPFELLVASGLIGILPLAICLYTNTFGALKMARRFWPQEQARWLRALARAMIFECLILCTDQNVLRVYAWFHLTMVILIAYNLEFIRNPGAAAPEADPHAFPLLEASTVR